MELIASHWTGNAYGTNTGKITLELSEQGLNPKGLLRFMDDTFGLALYEVTGTVSSEGISFKGNPTVEREGLVQGEITILGKLTPEGNIRGHWSSVIGTGGTFIVYPFSEGSPELENTVGIREQIFTSRAQLGFVQIYKEDVVNIVTYLRRDLPSGKIVVTFQSHEKAERVNYYDDFIKIDDLGVLTYLRLFISEPEDKGINRSINIQLRAHGVNELVVQGMTESWVLGEAQIMSKYLSKFKDKIRNSFNKCLGALQLVAMLGMIVLIASVDNISTRVLIAIGTFLLIYVAPKLFSRLFPNAIINMGGGTSHPVNKLLAQGGSWIIGFVAVTSSLVVEAYAQKSADAIEAAIRAVVNVFTQGG